MPQIVADDTWDVQEDAAEPAAAAAAALAPLLDGPSIIAAQDSLSFWEWVPNLVMCLSKTQFPAAQQAAVVALEMLTKESTDMSIALLASQDCVTALGQLLSSSSGVGGGGRRWRVAQAAAGALANLGSGSCATSCCKQMVREPGLVAQLVAILSDPEVDTRVSVSVVLIHSGSDKVHQGWCRIVCASSSFNHKCVPTSCVFFWSAVHINSHAAQH